MPGKLPRIRVNQRIPDQEPGGNGHRENAVPGAAAPA
jgi:hypothetical protein